MDPNETVRQLRETNAGPARIRELGGALREWITRGGFRPDGWSSDDERFRDRYFGSPVASPEAREVVAPLTEVEKILRAAFGRVPFPSWTVAPLPWGPMQVPGVRWTWSPKPRAYCGSACREARSYRACMDGSTLGNYARRTGVSAWWRAAQVPNVRFIRADRQRLTRAGACCGCGVSLAPCVRSGVE